MTTKKCEICGKRYKLPSYNVEGIAREHLCFTCEMVMNIVSSMRLAISVQYGDKYTDIEKYLRYIDKKADER